MPLIKNGHPAADAYVHVADDAPLRKHGEGEQQQQRGQCVQQLKIP